MPHHQLPAGKPEYPLSRTRVTSCHLSCLLFETGLRSGCMRARYLVGKTLRVFPSSPVKATPGLKISGKAFQVAPGGGTTDTSNEGCYETSHDGVCKRTASSGPQFGTDAGLGWALDKEVLTTCSQAGGPCEWPGVTCPRRTVDTGLKLPDATPSTFPGAETLGFIQGSLKLGETNETNADSTVRVAPTSSVLLSSCSLKHANTASLQLSGCQWSLPKHPLQPTQVNVIAAKPAAAYHAHCLRPDPILTSGCAYRHLAALDCHYLSFRQILDCRLRHKRRASGTCLDIDTDL